MKNLTLLALCATAFFSACKDKDKPSPVAPRDQYAGTWKGTFTILGEFYRGEMNVAKMSGSPNKITFTFTSPARSSFNEAVGAVKENTVTFDEWIWEGTDPSTKITYTITHNGTATINGASLTALGVLEVNDGTNTANGSWTWTFAKQ